MADSVNPVSRSPIQRGALRISSKIANAGKVFGRGLRTTLDATNDTIKRTAEKIKSKQKAINAEKAKQVEIERKSRETRNRKEKENTIEAASIVRPVRTLVNNVIAKPLKSFWNLLAAWAVANLPSIIKGITVFIKKVRIVGAAIKRGFGAIKPFFGSLVNIMKAFVKNLAEFDFNDSKGRLEKAKLELDDSIEEINLSIGEIGNVWGREEKELDKMLAELEDGKTMKETLNAILPAEAAEISGVGAEEGEQQVERLTPAFSGSQTGSDNVRALLDTISFAEGTPSYGTIYGGVVVPELARGELTVSEVIKMQKTGKVRGRNAGYKRDGYNSDATGRYQFMSYVLEEEVKLQNIPLNQKFTPALQDQMILSRIARMRGVTRDVIEREGLSVNVIDRLAPEFASFPNLIGPDAQGRTGTNTSYYGQGGKSQGQLQDFFGKAQKENKIQPLQAPTKSAPGQTPPAPGRTAPSTTSSPAQPTEQPTVVDRIGAIINNMFGVAPEADAAAESTSTTSEAPGASPEEAPAAPTSPTGKYTNNLVKNIFPNATSGLQPVAPAEPPAAPGTVTNTNESWLDKSRSFISRLLTGVAPAAAAPASADGYEVMRPTNSSVGGSTYTLSNLVPYSQFSKSAAEGGTGAVGKTSGYGQRWGRMHYGVDIGTSGQKGYGFRLKIQGRVITVTSSSGGGKEVEVQSGNLIFRMLHLDKIFVRKGPYNGEVIGEIGNTGRSTGEHLHLEVYVGGNPVDPQAYLNYLEIGNIKATSRSSEPVGKTAAVKADQNYKQIASRRTNFSNGTSPGSSEIVIIKETEIIQVG